MHTHNISPSDAAEITEVQKNARWSYLDMFSDEPGVTGCFGSHPHLGDPDG